MVERLSVVNRRMPDLAHGVAEGPGSPGGSVAAETRATAISPAGAGIGDEGQRYLTPAQSAPTTAEMVPALVEAMTRAVKVEAFMP